MSRLSSDFIVAAPADAVWEVVGRRFQWDTAIPASSAIPAPAAPLASGSAAIQMRNGPAIVAAPVARRVYRLGLRLLPQGRGEAHRLGRGEPYADL